MRLVLILDGFLSGVNAQTGTYLSHEPGTLVVAHDEVENLLAVSSQLPSGTASAVKAVKGSGVCLIFFCPEYAIWRV